MTIQHRAILHSPDLLQDYLYHKNEYGKFVWDLLKIIAL